MLKNKKTIRQHNLYSEKEIIKKYLLGKKISKDVNKYLDLLIKYNSHTNIVGKTTLTNPWTSHILDSLQLLTFIKNKNLSIVDMGSGAGLPGAILSIVGYNNVTLVDSNGKKIKFLKQLQKEISLTINIIYGRIEELVNIKYDIITSRALSNLDKLFSYSQKLMKKNTVLIFLKGKTVNEEILRAKKNWSFRYEKHKSISDSRGSILIVTDLKKND